MKTKEELAEEIIRNMKPTEGLNGPYYSDEDIAHMIIQGFEAGVEARGVNLEKIIRDCVEAASYRSYDESGQSLTCIDAQDLTFAIKSELSKIDTSANTKEAK